MTSAIKLIVGLGNIGAEYEHTRHNVGFDFVDEIARDYKVTFHHEPKFNGEVARCRIEGHDIWLLKPSTFMNRSGSAVHPMMQYYKWTPEQILVVHDELDLLPGAMNLKQGGGNAGHNGLKDIQQRLGTPNFWRLRMGIGHPRTLGLAMPVAAFVLARANAMHTQAIQTCFHEANRCLVAFAEGNFTQATRHINQFKNKTLPAEKVVASS